MKNLVSTEMNDVYEIAKRIIKIDQIMDAIFWKVSTNQRIVNIGQSLKLHKFNNDSDVLFYWDHPVIDHKIA